ncbi:MAG: hypothetical protein K8F54_06255 [Altibacter sp.]|uniref:hypothetical protein n=1 Tax=Altibacter sp. TaxID=2024823 RepID=UPI001D885B5D|nr:hypothetical protein [Altibacter sp.]MBZ0327190.1 hypothetical protein [Altibacter sp.]
MRKILTAILILNLTVAFSQTEKDLTEIIELVITEYQADTISVYNKFINDELLSALVLIKNQKDSNIHEKYVTKLDSNGNDLNWEIKTAEMYDDTVTVNIEKMKVKFFPAIEIGDKKDNKRIRRYTKIDLIKHKKKPFAYISFPLISIDGSKAVIYSGYVCGGLCGSGGIFYFEKVDGEWKIIGFERKWVV